MKKTYSFKLDASKLNFPHYYQCFQLLLQKLTSDTSNFFIKSFSVSSEKNEISAQLLFHIEFYDAPIYENYISFLIDLIQKQFTDILTIIES